MPESNAVNDSGTAGGEKAVDEGYRNILLVFDVVFGIFSLSMAVLAAASAFMGKTGWFTVVLLGSFVAINLGLSQVSNRVQNRLRLELFRIFIVNGVLGFLAFTRADGPFGHYWPCYLVMSLAAGTFFAAWLKKKIFAYLQIAFWLANLAAANFLAAETPMESFQFMVVSAVIAMSSALIIEMAQVFNLSLEKEKTMKTHLLQSSKMQALGEMAGGLAHEINNPLAIIHAHANILVELAAEQNPDLPAICNLAGTIESTATRIAAVVSGLRSFARDGTGDPLKTASVKSIVEETLTLCEQRLGGSGIELECSVPEDLRVRCRPVQISQVLLNLIVNAYDAVSPQADRQKWIRIEAGWKDGKIEISVADSGPGIPRELCDKIMQPFFTTKPVGSGTGLGLSVSKGIVESHNGNLYVDLHAPHTRFVFILPAAEPAIHDRKHPGEAGMEL